MPDKETLNKLNLSEFIALDLETTGLSSSTEFIIEIGAMKFIDGKPVESYESLVKPPISIPKFITGLTGISNDDVGDAPDIDKVLPEFMDYCGDYPLVAHNSPFDMGFLRAWAAKIDASSSESSKTPDSYFTNDVYDTALLSRIFFWWITNHKLVTLADYFDFDPANAHRAYADAERAGQVFLKVIDRLMESKYHTISTLSNLFEGTKNSSKKLFSRFSELIQSGEIAEGEELLPPNVKIPQNNVIGRSASVQIEAAPLLNLIDPKEVKAKFETGGELSFRLEGYEERPQQENMAFAVAEALNKGEMLAVEAGTGVGKTLAYLVPSILWSYNNRSAAQRVVISTRTKNLQDQLFYKDLPFLHQSLELPFKAVLLKGRNNYICLTRYHQSLIEPNKWLTAEERIQLAPIVPWIMHTNTGDIEENYGFNRNRAYTLWGKLSAESGKCSRIRCKQYNGCYLGKVREAAGSADLIVVNHSLLLADAASNNQVLNDYQNLVIDEAHNLEKDAWQFLGEELSIWKIRKTLSTLHEKDSLNGGALEKFASVLHLIKNSSESETISRLLETAIGRASESGVLATELFSDLNNSSEWVPKERSNYTSKIRYKDGDDFFKDVSGRTDKFFQSLYSLKKIMRELLEIVRDIPFGGMVKAEEALVDLLNGAEGINDLILTAENLFSAPEEDKVYWVELPKKSDSLDVRLFSVPINMAETLNEYLYANLRCGIFTSATLTTTGTFDYFLERSGVGLNDYDRLVTLEVGSPFDYENQSRIGIASFLPLPNDNDFNEKAVNLISEVNRKFRMGTLMLFTSYSMMNKFYDDLEPIYKDMGLLLLGQGKDGSRYALQEKLKNDGNGTLLGTDSFWEGIDVQGSALEFLVITKLPFVVPTEPIVLAIEDKLKSEGKNAFVSYSLPESIIKFRQGVGRLIRSKTDKGIVLILDNRVAKKQYGNLFVKSLPTNVSVLNSVDEVISWMEEFK